MSETVGKSRLLLLIVTLAGLLGVARSVCAGGYALVTTGKGGESHAGSFGGEAGWVGWRLLLGLGGAGVFSRGPWERINSNALLTYDEKRNNESEYYGALGWAVSRRWRLLGTGGVSVASRSGRTTTYAGTAVEWGPDYSRGRFAWSGQLQYERWGIVVGGGYDNRRGVVGRLGLRFLPAGSLASAT